MWIGKLNCVSRAEILNVLFENGCAKQILTCVDLLIGWNE